MEIKQFRYFSDNFGYLVYSGSRGIVIDPGGIEQILAFCKTHAIEITMVTNTHLHSDHTSGNQGLLEATQAEFFDCSKVNGDQVIPVGDEELVVFPTPGHTMDSVTFQGTDFIITGDTLFNGTVGNCFSGDLNAFFHSLKRLMALPPEYKVYSGHDYVKESMQYARIIEKDNPDIQAYLNHRDPELLVSTIEEELKVNPYIRFNAPAMIKNLKDRKMPGDTEFERFQSIMEVY